MNRIIKFRGWVSLGRGFMQYQQIGGGRQHDFEIDQNFCADIDLEDDPVMQYTGLQDKNGKDIYEGDIVRYVWGQDQQPSLELTVIKWENHSWNILFGYEQENNEWDEAERSSEYEIIGNIHENPDLLDKK